MTKKSYHVDPNPDGGWNVIKSGGAKAIKHFDNKPDAVSYARGLSKRQFVEFVIHGKNSYGNDPCPPRDKK